MITAIVAVAALALLALAWPLARWNQRRRFRRGPVPKDGAGLSEREARDLARIRIGLYRDEAPEPQYGRKP